MFSTSTQRKHWTFCDENELARYREIHNKDFISKYGAHVDEFQKYQVFLSPEEERLLLKQYELHLKGFCERFRPSMPKSVIGTSFNYFKRFYLFNSAMDYHPNEILITCVYLACKVDEFNLSINQFVANINGDREKAADIILNSELLLMKQLKFHLTVHSPFRPVEGFLIDIKTRTTLANPDRLRVGIDEFLENVFLTDACLLYAPSQIALSAVLHAASREQENLDSYVKDILFKESGPDNLAILLEAVHKIQSMVYMVECPSNERILLIEQKLDNCRNQEYNPDSNIYKQRLLMEALENDYEPPPPGSNRISLDMNGVIQVLPPSSTF